MLADKIIKLSLIAEAAKDDLRGETGIARVQRGCELPE
jgi:hypothetical protein